jgi:hypothetical protein
MLFPISGPASRSISTIRGRATRGRSRVLFFIEVCPNRTIIDSTEINGGFSEPSAATTLQVWVDKLAKTEDRYVEINEYPGQIFDLWCDPSRYPILVIDRTGKDNQDFKAVT